MDITPLTPQDRLIINRYGDGGFVINNESHKGDTLILLNRVVPWNDTGDLLASLQPFFEAGELPEILLIGWGKQFKPLPPELRTLLRQKGIFADSMDTGAACRTYNVLLAEGRKVVAALIAV